MASMSTKPGSDVRPPSAIDRAQVLFDAQPQGAIAVDGHGAILFATPVAARLLERPLDAGVPLLPLLRAYRPDDEAADDTAAHGTLQRDLERGIELQAADRWLWVKLERARPGSPAAAVAWLHDVTDLHQALDRRTESLRFLSHDLRSPQNSIVALTQLHEHDQAAFEACGGMQRIAELARYALSLGDQYIFSSVADVVRHRDFVRFDLRRAIRSLIPKLEVAAVYRDVALRLWLADGPAVWMSGVQVFVMRALQNLIDNAIQASRAGARVTVSLRVEDGTAVVVVGDEAGGLPGLSPDRPMTDFDALSPKASGGYGIGLKLAARIVALHGGTLHAEVNRESGTDFVLRLPRLVLQAGIRNSPAGRRTGPAALERQPLDQAPRQRRLTPG
ncbi:HAMP domain-containing histidine kinase [Burkholderia pyrrocinia]|uniref:sensor histidine kinase n=1 Tax=Burkholderia sp. IT-111MI5 TaxID=3026439 RepID=UPI002A328AA7|nr:HAMP domain-containing histidine kinase [Burkholderia pyrrocinia]EKS9894672.1 HAMP domain-containing histidine kinase [Burkholderia pyrrocinia]EKS9906965.1 HAMP domain-containing histidine kinase [Burkholderia pyrrocinia]